MFTFFSGSYFIMVYAYDSFTGVSLKAEYTGPTTTTTSSTFSITTQIAPAALAPPHASGSTKLTINVPKVGIAMTKGQSLHFRLTVTSLPELFIVTSAMNGDVDLYVKRGGLASRSSFDKKSLTSSSDESVQFTAPKPGRNFVYHHVFFSNSQARSRLASNKDGGNRITRRKPPPDSKTLAIFSLAPSRVQIRTVVEDSKHSSAIKSA